MVEKGKFISFANCGLPYYIGDVILVLSPEASPINPFKSLSSQKINELDKNKTYLVYCRTGIRSYIACRILYQKRFKVRNITGGYFFTHIHKIY